MFTIEMLPAGYGDCLWIEYGKVEHPERILIDAGTLPTYKALRKRIEELPKNQRHFELFVITHIDTDHIDAAVKLLNSPSLGVRFDQIWFNEWKHLSRPEELGAIQGEYTGALIEHQRIPLNQSFRGESVVIPDSGPLPTHQLPGGMRLTLLSPTWERLTKLRSQWKSVLSKVGLIPGGRQQALKDLAKHKKYADLLGAPRLNVQALGDSVTPTDSATNNGSSIAVLAEYEGKECLFGADAFPDVLGDSIDRLLKARKTDRLTLHAYKVAHHGSKFNTTIDLLKRLSCETYLFSSNGKIFHHPDRESVARVIRHGGAKPKLFFNYTTPETRVWDNRALKDRFKYAAYLPSEKRPGQRIEL